MIPGCTTPGPRIPVALVGAKRGNFRLVPPGSVFLEPFSFGHVVGSRVFALSHRNTSLEGDGPYEPIRNHCPASAISAAFLTSGFRVAAQRRRSWSRQCSRRSLPTSAFFRRLPASASRSTSCLPSSSRSFRSACPRNRAHRLGAARRRQSRRARATSAPGLPAGRRRRLFTTSEAAEILDVTRRGIRRPADHRPAPRFPARSPPTS